MLIQHGPLRGIVTTQQRANQQTVMLIQLLHRDICRTVQLDETLLAAAAEQGSSHVVLWLVLDAGTK